MEAPPSTAPPLTPLRWRARLDRRPGRGPLTLPPSAQNCLHVHSGPPTGPALIRPRFQMGSAAIHSVVVTADGSEWDIPKKPYGWCGGKPMRIVPCCFLSFQGPPVYFLYLFSFYFLFFFCFIFIWLSFISFTIFEKSVCWYIFSSSCSGATGSVNFLRLAILWPISINSR